MKRVGASVQELDDFTRRRFSDIADRWNTARRVHQHTERMLWLGTIAHEFADDELSILASMGYLCEWDHILMRAARRPIQPWPPAAAGSPETGAPA